MDSLLNTLFQSFTLPKLVYSLVLVGIVLLLLAELNRLWLDGKTYISPFKSYEAGALSAQGGDVFAMRVIDYHSALTQRLVAAGDSASDAEKSWSPGVGEPL